MARPRGGKDNPVTLFPFLSILACVIGTLILLISSVSVLQMESGPDKDLVKRVEEYKELEEEQKAMEESIATVLPKLHELEQYKEALRKLEKLAAELRKKSNTLSLTKKEQEELKKLLAEMKKLQETIAKAKKKDNMRDKTLDELREELKRRKMVFDAPTVTVMPAKGGAGGAGKCEPVFVEADGKGLVLDPGGKRFRVALSKITTAPAFKKTVVTIARDRGKVLVILIRPNGVTSYRVADKFARTNQALVAKLPVIGQGKLDLSRF